MYLKSIKSSGFKSFADKIDLEINSGITGIVGPNGSGKSNIVDAIRWVLGEQSVKALRGDSLMSDVIFSGSKSREAATRSMVSLTFDNSDHYLNSEFNELEIKRILYRNGDNEFYLNNTKVRLKDITDLFTDSGAGKGSFNIISQGAVTDIVNSKPYERRVIFEEAAGVLKYKKRKEETLKKLEKAKINLDKVELVIKELSDQLEPLKKQAEVAKKYLDYNASLKNIEISLIAKDITEMNIEYKNLKDRQEQINSQLEGMALSNNQDIAKMERAIADLEDKKQLITERKKYEVDDIKLENNILNLKEEQFTINKNITTL